MVEPLRTIGDCVAACIARHLICSFSGAGGWRCAVRVVLSALSIKGDIYEQVTKENRRMLLPGYHACWPVWSSPSKWCPDSRSATARPPHKLVSGKTTRSYNRARRSNCARARCSGLSAARARTWIASWQVAGWARTKARFKSAKFALQKAESPQVKQFAQMMVDDHGQLTPKLQPLAMAQAGDQGRQPSAAPSNQYGAQGAGGNQAVNQLIAIEKQIGERCSELLRQELEQKQGADFDKCYIGAEIGAHMQASAALGVISQQAASQQLKQLASQAKQTVDQHLRRGEGNRPAA